MAVKPTYEELAQQVARLQKEFIKREQASGVGRYIKKLTPCQMSSLP